MNQIILDKNLFHLPQYKPQVSNLEHCNEFFEKSKYVYEEDCDVFQPNTFQVKLDNHTYIQRKDDFSFIHTVIDPLYPTQLTSTFHNDKQSSINNLFNKLFNPPTFIFSQLVYLILPLLLINYPISKCNKLYFGGESG